MAHLSLSFLGTFKVVLDKRPITHFRSVNVQGLLVYLSLNTNRAISRDVLAALFWPDEPESTAKKNLRQTIYHLRKLLTDNDDLDQPFLLVTRQSLQFNPDCDHTLDVVAFLEAVKADELSDAATHYTGELLPGFTCPSLDFEDWLRHQREQLHHQATDVFGKLTDKLIDEGEFSEAVAIAHKQLGFEPWRESAHRQLMLALAYADDRTAALAQYEICVELLAEELGIPPSLETTTIYKAILAGKLLPGVIKETTARIIPNNLPRQTTPFIGREAELANLSAILLDTSKPLITIIGPGGMGKTSLILNAARELVRSTRNGNQVFTDGIFFVPLAPITEPESISMALGDAVGFRFEGRSELFEQVLGFLHDKKMLLILDNFEHLMAGREIINKLLHKAPNVQCCITSRQRLNLRSEQLFSIGALDIPTGSMPFSQTAAEKLFLQSVYKILPGFMPSTEDYHAIARICWMVQGLPLAIVLAAGWVDVLPLSEIAAEIQQDKDFLATDLQDVPERQRSLRETFEYSWKLLEPVERDKYAQLSIFQGGFTREAVMAVIGAPPRLLARLVNKSLLQFDPGKDRYQIHELLRQFGEEKLRHSPQENSIGAISENDVRSAHSHYYLGEIAQRKRDLMGWNLEEAVRDIMADYENIRAAWDWAIKSGDVQLLGQASASIFRFHRIQSLLAEGRRMMARAAEGVASLKYANELDQVENVYGRLLGHQGMFTFFLGDLEEATHLLKESVGILQNTQADEALLSPLNHLAYVRFCADEYDDALLMCERAIELSKKIRDPFNQSYAHRTTGSIYAVRGDFERSAENYEQALALSQQIGDRRGEGLALNRLGITARIFNEQQAAEKYHLEALQIFRDIGYRQGEGQVLNRLGVLKWYQGQFEVARKLFEQALAIGREISDWQLIGGTLHRIGNYLWTHGQHSAAVIAYKEVVEMYRQIGDRQSEGYVLDNLALLSLYKNQVGDTLDYCRRVMEIADDVGIPPLKGFCLISWGHTLLAMNQLESAEEKYAESLQLWRELGQERPTIQPTAGLALIALKRGRVNEALRFVDEILLYLERDNLEGSDEPLRVYDVCIQIMEETDDVRLADFLEAAYDRLQKRAETITNPVDRRAFLENVPFHQRIISASDAFSRKTLGKKSEI